MATKKDFNRNHPELREGEIFIMNTWDNGCNCSWKTKRLGNQAYDIHGNPMRDGTPLFAQKKELDDAGVPTAGMVPIPVTTK